MGKLRFALTSRYINPCNIPTLEHWKGNFHIDAADAYSGDQDGDDRAPGTPGVGTSDSTNPSHDTQMTNAPVNGNLESTGSLENPQTAITSDTSDARLAPSSLTGSNIVGDTIMAEFPSQATTAVEILGITLDQLDRLFNNDPSDESFADQQTLQDLGSAENELIYGFDCNNQDDFFTYNAPLPDT